MRCVMNLTYWDNLAKSAAGSRRTDDHLWIRADTKEEVGISSDYLSRLVPPPPDIEDTLCAALLKVRPNRSLFFFDG